jgi:hypothetical protein
MLAIITNPNKALKLLKLNKVKYIIKINKLILYSPLYNLLKVYLKALQLYF